MLVNKQRTRWREREKKQKAQKLANCYEYTREILSRHTHTYTHKHTVEEQTLVEFRYCFAPVVLFFLTLSLGCCCVFYVYHCMSPHTHTRYGNVCVHTTYTLYCRLHSRMPILPMPIKLTIKLYVNIA